MNPLRRLDAESPSDPYRKALRGGLRSMTLSEAEFRAVPEARLAIDGEAVLIAAERHGRFDLHYAYPDHGEFTKRFPEMLAHLLPACDIVQAPLGLRLRLTNRTSHPYVAPVLRAQGFDLAREWMEMLRHDLPDDGTPGDEVAPGFPIRPVRKDDVEAIVRLEELAFPASLLTVDLANDALSAAPLYCVIEERATSAIAGSLLAELRPDGTGHVSTIAIHPDFQRRGLGEAAMRWALAAFRERGARRAGLVVTTSNAPAIALYRKLGFVEHEIGFDYSRSLDEDEVRRLLAPTGPRISVRRRFR